MIELDKELFFEFVRLGNMVVFGKKTQEDFNSFVLDNKCKMNNPDFLQVFAENVELFNEQFYIDNFEMCNTFYELIQNNPDWRKLDYGLRTAIRIGTFEDEFKELLDKRNGVNRSETKEG